VHVSALCSSFTAHWNGTAAWCAKLGKPPGPMHQSTELGCTNTGFLGGNPIGSSFSHLWLFHSEKPLRLFLEASQKNRSIFDAGLYLISRIMVGDWGLKQKSNSVRNVDTQLHWVLGIALFSVPLPVAWLTWVFRYVLGRVLKFCASDLSGKHSEAGL
jgi:hypothetical protein